MAGCDLEIYLSPRQLCDTELICNGGFSPLTGFMTEEEYMSVVENNRLPNGLLFGLPVVYDTDREDLKPGRLVLSRLGWVYCTALSLAARPAKQACSGYMRFLHLGQRLRCSCVYSLLRTRAPRPFGEVGSNARGEERLHVVFRLVFLCFGSIGVFGSVSYKGVL